MSQTTREPNLYDLASGEISIQYATTSIAGVPVLSGTYCGQQLSFRGDQIRVESSELGRIVSVTIESVPDLHTRTLSLFIPPVNLAGGQDSPLQTVAVVSTHRTSIGGPRLVRGQLVSYEPALLRGKASAVDF